VLIASPSLRTQLGQSEFRISAIYLQSFFSDDGVGRTFVHC